MKIARSKERLLRRRRGQGMTEYIIIVGLIAILLITAVQAFSDKLKQTFEKSTTAIDKNVTTQIDKVNNGTTKTP